MSSTDLVNFRDQFLAKTEARLNALDIAAASDETLLLNSALLKAYAAVNDFDVISVNALSFLSNKTGAQLETALQDPSNWVRFDEIVASTSTMLAVTASSAAMTTIAGSSIAMASVVASSVAMTAIAASSVAMTAIAASSVAMPAIAASSVAMPAIAASSAAVTAIWASDTATNSVVASSIARLAVYNSDIALAALQANPTQVQRLITNGAASNVVAYISSAQAVIVANGTKLILLRRRFNNSTGLDVLDWARGDATSGVGHGPTGGGRNLDTGVNAVGCQSGTYVSNGAVPTAEDYTGNFVSAANGLQTRIAPATSVYIKYILV